MKKILVIFLLFFSSAILYAQTESITQLLQKIRFKNSTFSMPTAIGPDERNGLLIESIDPESDSIAIAKMRERMAEIRKERPTVALVLAGGGAKGAAHVGVIKMLEEKGIPVDFITGTSMGGLIGGLYALGYNGDQLDSILRSADWKKLMSDFISPTYYSYQRRKDRETYILNIPFHYSSGDWENRVSSSDEVESGELVNGMQKLKASLPEGYLYGLNVYNLLSALSTGYQSEMDFADLPIPYFCVAADAVTMKEKNWTHGTLVDAMRSTMSIPLYFRPVRTDGMILIDGGTLNNFPVDLARTMGADIVIGVDLDTSPTYGEVNNALDIMMCSMDGARNESYRISIENLDVHVKPDMTGYNMLSFSASQIDDIINRGYTEAQKHNAELDSIVVRLGTFSMPEIRRNVTDVHSEKVLVKSFSFEGLNDEEKEHFAHKVRLKPGERYNSEDFEKAVALLYSSGAFNMVTYRLYGTEEPYECVFVCEKGPINQFNVGLRADSQESIALLMDLGINTNKSIGSSFDINLKCGFNPYLNFEYKYVPMQGSAFGAALKMSYTLRESTDVILLPNNFTEQFWRNEAMAFFDTADLRHVLLRLGARITMTPYIATINIETPQKLWDWKSFYTYAFARLRFNNLDDTFFPNRGVKLNADYDYMITGYDHINGIHVRDEHFLKADITVPIRLGNRFVLQPSLAARFITNKECSDDYMINHVGGIMPGRFYDNQIAYMGIGTCIDADARVIVGDVNLRYHIKGNHYLSLVGSVMENGPSIFNLPKPEFAVGLRYGLKTLMGPVMLNVHWADQRNWGFYMSIGFDF